MSPVESIFIKRVWIVVITAIVLQFASTIFGIPERISGMNGKIKELEVTKMSKEDGGRFMNDLNTKVAEQVSLWNQYMISNEKDKERILKDLEIIQEDIKQLIGKSRTTTRSVPQQVSGGKAIAPNK